MNVLCSSIYVITFLALKEKLLKFGEYCDLAKKLVLSVREVIIRLERQKLPKAIPAIKVRIWNIHKFVMLVTFIKFLPSAGLDKSRVR